MVVGLRFGGGGRGGVPALITGEFKKAEGDGMVMVSISVTSCGCGNTLTKPALYPSGILRVELVTMQFDFNIVFLGGFI